jgi:hypothetical protein
VNNTSDKKHYSLNQSSLANSKAGGVGVMGVGGDSSIIGMKKPNDLRYLPHHHFPPGEVDPLDDISIV